MFLQRKNLKSIIMMLLKEGRAEDLISLYPELQTARDAGIKNHAYLDWMSKILGTEPIQDIVPAIQAFDRMKQRLKLKGISTNIYDYENASDLRQTLESLGSSKKLEVQKIKEKETTYLGTFGDWLVAMPHTTNSSCLLGKGTTWCTAATKSKNLFLSYVAKPDVDIILYYIIKIGDDSRSNPEAKLSVGFIDGIPYLKGDDGNITVDAKNKGINENRLSLILGNQFVPIMSAMKNHAKLIGNQHPGKEELITLIKDNDTNKIDKIITKMNFEEQMSFIETITDYDEVSPKVLSYLAYHAQELYEGILFDQSYLDDDYDDYNGNRLDRYARAARNEMRAEEENKEKISSIRDVMYLIKRHKNTPPNIAKLMLSFSLF